MSEPSNPSPGPSVSMWELLRSIGFEQDPDSFAGAGRCFNFGNFTLQASESLSSRFSPIVSIRGVFRTERHATLVQAEIPAEVESRELGVALLAYYLDRYIGDKLAFVPEWLDEGRRARHLLPWERNMAAYNARPHCYVPRQWARLALNTLAQQLSEVSDDEPVEFRFDGRILTVQHSGKLIPLQANGQAWESGYKLPAASLREAPKRLMRDPVEFAIWEASLVIDGQGFRGAVELSQ